MDKDEAKRLARKLNEAIEKQDTLSYLIIYNRLLNGGYEPITGE